MELKFVTLHDAIEFWIRSNRTFMELKSKELRLSTVRIWAF